MPALGIERELDKDLAAHHPRTRYQDLAIWLRRLTVESPDLIPDNSLLTSSGGVILRVRSSDTALIAASLPPGASAQLQDGEPLTWDGGRAVLRVEVVAKFGGVWDHTSKAFISREPKAPQVFDLQESQVDFARWFARFRHARRGARRARGQAEAHLCAAGSNAKPGCCSKSPRHSSACAGSWQSRPGICRVSRSFKAQDHSC